MKKIIVLLATWGQILLWAACQLGTASISTTHQNQTKTDTLKPQYLTHGELGPDDYLLNKAALKLGFEFHTVGCKVDDQVIDSIKQNNAAVEKILEQKLGKNWKKLWEQEFQRLKQQEDKNKK